MSKTETARKNEWNGKKYDRINFIVKQGDKEKIKSAAAIEMKSINKFILDAINATHPDLLNPMDDDSKKKKPDSEKGPNPEQPNF